MSNIITHWPDADSDKLRDLWSKGLSCTEISRAFSGKYSRLSIAGKARRLNLSSRDSHANRQNGVRRAPMPKPKPIPKPTIIVPSTEPKAIGTVGEFPNDRSTCRWTHGDGAEFQICGHEGFPWCAYHRSVVFAKQLPAKNPEEMNRSSRAARNFR